MTITVPSSAQGAFAGNMNTSQKIELPFIAPAFYILNGDANFEELKNVMYFGGWAVSKENIKTASEQWQDCPFPIPTLAEKDLRPKSGPAIQSFVSRSLIVAPIGMREFSTIKENGQTKRIPPFTKGGRPAIQVLAMLAYLGEDKKTITPWAPVMLTANGFQVNHVKRAFTDWKNAIKPFMTTIAPGVPEDVTNLFYMNIGTFGTVRKDETHGESTITPITAFIPEGLTAAQVEGRYVGDDMAVFMADMANKAREWLKAYKSQPAQPQQATAAYTHEDPPPPEDDIPF
jgi:hypothetical protein